MTRRLLSCFGAAVLLVGAAAVDPCAAADSLGDEARHAGKPLIVDFGMTRCLQCIEQSKAMDELKAAIGDRVLVKFVHVGQEEALAAAHKVLLIPTLVFFDAQGREVFRNVGQMKKEAMLSQARELGLVP